MQPTAQALTGVISAEIAAALIRPAGEREDRLEALMLEQPQAHCPVAHYFGPGVCVREVSMVAGTMAIGHHQKFEHLNILLKGAVEMLEDDGSTKILRAPLIFVGKPGRKIGLVVEDMVWLNVYATDERDVQAIEERFVDKSPQWQEHDAKRRAALLARAADQGDAQ
jgi:enamine deaminase RidA (YjgF/YER057c/UK114 family)